MTAAATVIRSRRNFGPERAANIKPARKRMMAHIMAAFRVVFALGRMRLGKLILSISISKTSLSTYAAEIMLSSDKDETSRLNRRVWILPAVRYVTITANPAAIGSE